MTGSGRSPLVFKLPTFSQTVMTILEYGWAVVVVLNGNSVYHANAIGANYFLELSILLTIVLFFAHNHIYHIRPLRDQVILSVGMMLYAMAYMSVMQSRMAIINFVLLFIFALPGLLLMFSAYRSSGRLMCLMRRIFDVVLVLALISLFYWVFGVMLQLLRPNCVMYIKWGYLHPVVGFDGVHFMVQIDTTFFPEAFVYRNSGIFAEAPMFNLWLSLALAGELFLSTRPSKMRTVVLMVTMLTTMSVTGILFIALCAGLWVCLHYRQMDRKQRAAVLVVGCILLPVVIGAMIATLTLKSDTESFTMRLYDYVAGVRLWMDHPLMGAGYGDLTPLMQYAYSPNGVMGFSNSLTAVLGTGGAWMSVVFYVPHLRMLSVKCTGDAKLVCFGICDLFLFCTTLYFARFIGVLLVAFSTIVAYGRWKK
ncbi:MAG: O-antigen ligase family protein [Oscillospiraceae bacterium]|nr:O-antigen ligase family protein [Oscillospiraceae bacterium]